MKNLVGKVVEIGDLPALAGACGVLLEVSREDLAKLQCNVLFSRVELVPVNHVDEEMALKS